MGLRPPDFLRTALILILMVCNWTPPVLAGQSLGLTDLLDGVEGKLERMDDMSADFLQIYDDPLNRTVEEEGHLYLRRPRMMRWEYRSPEEKLFVSDGRTVYLYLPVEQQVTRDSVNESFDDRIPLMFLLGRSDLQSEFTRISLLGTPPKVPGTQVLQMYPRRQSDVQEVTLEVDPRTFDIRRLQLSYRDGAISEFIFSRVETNIGLDRSMFDFVPPPDAELVEGIAQ